MDLIKKLGNTLYKSINEAFDFNNIDDDHSDNLNNDIIKNAYKPFHLNNNINI